MLRGSIFIYVTVIISSMFLYNIGTIDRARYVVSHHQKGARREGGLPMVMRVDLPRPPPPPSPFFTGLPHVRKPSSDSLTLTIGHLTLGLLSWCPLVTSLTHVYALLTKIIL